MKRAMQILNKKGVALITVVLIFLILVVMLSGVMFWSVSNNSKTAFGSQHTAAYYSAESAINLQLARFEELYAQAKTSTPVWDVGKVKAEFDNLMLEINNNNRVDFSDFMGQTNFSLITVSKVENKLGFEEWSFFEISAEGKVGDVTRILSTEFGFRQIYRPGIIPELGGAIIVKGGINISNSQARIQGNIASNLEDFGDPAGQIVIENQQCGVYPAVERVWQIAIPNPTTPENRVRSGTGQRNPSCSSQISNLSPTTITFEDISLPPYTPIGLEKQIVNGVLDLTGSNLPTGQKRFYISDFPNNNLSIKLDGHSEDELIYLRVNGSYNFNSRVTIEGQGRLLVLMDLKTNINLNSPIFVKGLDGSEVLATDTARFNVVFRKVDDVRYTLRANGFRGSVLTDADVLINFQNNAYYGFMVTRSTGTVSITSNSILGTETSPIWIYTPLAHAHYQAGTNLYGSVIAQSFYMQSGNTKIIHKDLNTLYPFQQWAPLPYNEEAQGSTSDLEFVIEPIIEN